MDQYLTNAGPFSSVENIARGSRPGSRGRAVRTVAGMRGVPMSSIDPADPLIEELIELPAYALDYALAHYRPDVHGSPGSPAIRAMLGWTKPAVSKESAWRRARYDTTLHANNVLRPA
jgi:hypothetical protein